MLTFLIVAITVAAPSIAELFARAAKRAGLSHKELAYAMGLTPPRLSNQLRGNGSYFSVARLFLAPSAFRDTFTEELRADLGCEKPVTARDVLDLIRPVMARASASAQRRQSCA